MTYPSRQEAVRILDEGYDALMETASQLSPDRLDDAGGIPGGAWSIKDLIGHLATWEEVALETIEEWVGVKKPAVVDRLSTKGAVDAFNDERVRDKTRLFPSDVLADAGRVHSALVGEIEKLSDEQWNARSGYPTDRPIRLGKLLSLVLGAPGKPFGHTEVHLEELRVT